MVIVDNRTDPPQIKWNWYLPHFGERYFKKAMDMLFCKKNAKSEVFPYALKGVSEKDFLKDFLKFEWLFAYYPHLCHALTTYDYHKPMLKSVLSYCVLVSFCSSFFLFFVVVMFVHVGYESLPMLGGV